MPLYFLLSGCENTFTNESTIYIEAEQGNLSNFVVENGLIFTEEKYQGSARYNFTIEQNGLYEIHTRVRAPASDANSFYVAIDNYPEQGKDHAIWDVEESNHFQELVVGHRGLGTAEQSEFPELILPLQAGEHVLLVDGREKHTEIDWFSIVMVDPEVLTER